MNVSADWGLMWADIDAENANELDITVRGEGILWDANIGCPAASTGDSNCRITLVTDESEIGDFSLDWYYYGSGADDLVRHNGYDEYNLAVYDPEQLSENDDEGFVNVLEDGYFLSAKFGEGFVTALMTGTRIVVSDLASIEVNCDGPESNTLYGVLFSDVDDKSSIVRGIDRSRRPQIEVTGPASNIQCELDFTWNDEFEKDLKCKEGQSVPGTCGQYTPPTKSPTASPTKKPTTQSPTPSPTVDPTIAWRKQIRELQEANAKLPARKWKQTCAQTKTRLENTRQIIGLRCQISMFRKPNKKSCPQREGRMQVLSTRIDELEKPDCTDMELQVLGLRVEIDGLK